MNCFSSCIRQRQTIAHIATSASWTGDCMSYRLAVLDGRKGLSERQQGTEREQSLPASLSLILDYAEFVLDFHWISTECPLPTAASRFCDYLLLP
jgi:hypothetical protein